MPDESPGRTQRFRRLTTSIHGYNANSHAAAEGIEGKSAEMSFTQAWAFQSIMRLVVKAVEELEPEEFERIMNKEVPPRD